MKCNKEERSVIFKPCRHFHYCSQLALLPDSGQIELLLKKIGQNSRYLVEGSYKIIYQHDEKTVIITDVFHTSQNPKKIISRSKKKKF